MAMELFYWQSPNGNVGDDLNAWLWPKVLGPDALDAPGTHSHAAPAEGDRRFLGIGSVLVRRHLLPKPGRNVIFGPGLRSAEDAAGVREHDLRIAFVRGPLSAAALGGCPFICDPAILAPGHFQRHEAVPGRIGFVPYMTTPAPVVDRIRDETGVVPIPTTLPVEQFLSALTRCEYVVCEAMHGAILADSFRIPWAGCRISSAFHEGPTSIFKWTDWQRSLALEAPPVSSVPDWVYFRPRRLRRLARGHALRRGPALVGQILRRDQWTLSDPGRIESARSRILDEANALRASLHA
ncbi:MAG: polysaccharide pyruvyl transferase family protein [Rhodobacteraceae bacterium]|nr:polysaccharide pyruvyl transferase family protein [Paracoccaceae bacterium]MBR9821957.1 polysaccharide pyruvyl transferase family protein [Paracoccaceae bacterium]